MKQPQQLQPAPANDSQPGNSRPVQADSQSYAELDQILKSIAECVWSAEVDPEGQVHYRYYSPAMERISGRPVEFFMGGPERWLSVVHPEDRPVLESALARILTGQSHRDVKQYRIVRPDGTIRWVSDSVVASRIGIASLRLHGVMCDITETRQAEVAAQRSEARFRHLLESTRIIPWEADAQTWKFTYVGPQAVGLLGYPVQQWYEKDFWVAHIHPDDREKTLDFCLKSSQEATNYDFEYRMVSANGDIVWLHDVVTTEFVDGVPRMLRGFLIDITERKRAETIRRASEERLRQLIELAPDAIVAVRQDGRIALVNRQTERLFGYRRDELFGQPVERLIPERFHAQHVSDRRGYAAAPATRPMAVRGVPLVAVCKNGEEVPVEINLGSLETDEGLLIVSSIRDVSRLRQAQAEATQHRNALAHASRVTSLGELAAALAHELNQPLAAILNNAHAAARFLERDPPDFDEVREILTDIIADDRRAGDVIHRLRSMMKKEETKRELVDVGHLVDEVVTLMHSEFVIKNVIITLDLQSDLPPVYADRIQIQQVLVNLVSNAIEAVMDREAGAREIRIATRLAESGQVTVLVKDTGKGIRDDKLHMLFESFYSSRSEGLGMGLAISRSLVEAHGGRIWAANNPEHGATFSFVLPSASEASP